MPDQPEDPLTELVAGAALQHEVYLAYIAAGFTEPQALELLKAIITAQIGGTS